VENWHSTLERKIEIGIFLRIEGMVIKSGIMSSGTRIIPYTFVLIVKVSKKRCFLQDKNLFHGIHAVTQDSNINTNP
jgi:hypothetical protein